MKRCARNTLSHTLLPIFCLLVGAVLIALSVYACIGVSFFPILLILLIPFAGGLIPPLFRFFLQKAFDVLIRPGQAHGLFCDLPDGV